MVMHLPNIHGAFSRGDIAADIDRINFQTIIYSDFII